VPAPDAFDACFGEAGLDVYRDFHDSLGQFYFYSVANESAVPDFDAFFDADIPTWDETVFGESYSRGSTSSSLSSWDGAFREESPMNMDMGADIDMQLQFPTVKVDAIGDGIGMPTDDEFLRVIMEAAQSSPKTVSPLS
jgi:hypothetical protein